MSGSYYEYLDEKQDKDKIMSRIYNRVLKFMEDNDIDCEETIYQCDWVIEHAYEFIGDLFRIIETDLPVENEE